MQVKTLGRDKIFGHALKCGCKLYFKFKYDTYKGTKKYWGIRTRKGRRERYVKREKPVIFLRYVLVTSSEFSEICRPNGRCRHKHTSFALRCIYNEIISEAEKEKFLSGSYILGLKTRLLRYCNLIDTKINDECYAIASIIREMD